MYVELREKTGKHYVMIRHEDSKEKPVAQFISSNPVEAYNVAKQFAKQHKCLIRATKGGIETPEVPMPPDLFEE
jgi:ribosomal protein L10|tara:strand:+ start:315 stop:536 length:222 start_codon:yes stop_codon:yes gene_type:complete